MPRRCCSPSDRIRFQWASSASFGASAGSPTAHQHLGDLLGREVAVLAGIDHRLLQRGHREVGPLRQDHQLGAFRHHDLAGRERPQAGDGAEERRFAAARGAGHQRMLAGFDADVVAGDERRPRRQAHRQALDGQAGLGLVGLDVDPRLIGAVGGLRGCDRVLEAVEPRDHRAPLCELLVDRDEERQRVLHAVEGGRCLHQSAELDHAREVGRADHDDREHDRCLGVSRW